MASEKDDLHPSDRGNDFSADGVKKINVFDDDDISDEENATKECGVINYEAKFSTESKVFKPIDYFTQVQREMVELRKLFVKVDSQDKFNTCPGLLNYDNDLARFDFLPSQHSQQRRQFVEDLRKNNLKSNFNVGLATFQHRSQFTNKDTYRFSRKYASYEFTANAIVNRNSRNITPQSNCLDHAVYVKVYVPCPPRTRREGFKLQQEIVIGGRQTLRELAEAINCPLDSLKLNDVSSLPHMVPATPEDMKKSNKTLFPSVFFFINNTFYSDGPEDIVSNVKNFLIKNDAHVNPTLTLATKFCDMSLQVGRPYLFQHNAQCEHVIMISNMRLQKKNQAMPLLVAVSNAVPRVCSICEARYVRWVVQNFKKYVQDPAYFCHVCLKSYCYKGGEKIGNFSVYEYIDSVALE